MRAEAQLAIRLALRHHPLCDRFDGDRFGPVCSGCAVFWPAFALAWMLALTLWSQGASAWALLAAGTVLGLPQLLGLRWRLSRPLRAGVKLLGGAGVALALTGTLLLPASWLLRGVLLALMAASFSVLMVLRMRSILATCDACIWKRDWGRCPGFGALDALDATNQTLTWQESQA